MGYRVVKETEAVPPGTVKVKLRVSRIEELKEPTTWFVLSSRRWPGTISGRVTLLSDALATLPEAVKLPAGNVMELLD